MNKIVAINASPRTQWNTSTLIRQAALGAEAEGAGVKVFDLYKLEKYSGCISCFGCKLPENLGKCVCRDGLSPVLEEIRSADGLILGTPGCFSGDTRVLLASGDAISFADLVSAGITETCVKALDENTGEIVDAYARDIRIEKYAQELKKISFADGTEVCCTGTHLILDADGEYIEAGTISEGTRLSGGHIVTRVSSVSLSDPVPVYDMTVPRHLNYVLENGLVVHNSGKSFSAKREISNVFLATGDDIMICDPEGEYFPLVQRLEGQVIKISPTSKHHINPMDINLNYSDEENPLSLKSDFILSLCELIVGGKDGLKPVEKTIIDRCVRMVYQDYLNDPKPENMPILGDLYDCLRKQEEKEAQFVATALEIYVTGSLNVFNHQTDVDVSNRVVCYDIKELGKQLKKIGMLIVQDQVWNRVTINREASKATRYYIDEFHLLLKEEQTGNLEAVPKMGRYPHRHHAECQRFAGFQRS